MPFSFFSYALFLDRLLDASDFPDSSFVTAAIEGGVEPPVDDPVYLVLGPVGAQVNAYESYYLIGHLFKEPLIAVRDFMGRVGLEKKPEEYAEPEDVIAFELEIMNWLVGKQLGANNSDEEEGWVLSQAEFLKKHLLIWGPACSKDIGAAEAADFYKGVAAILGGFLELERLHFHGFGPDKIETIEEARRRYGSKPAWRGTTFDPEGAGGLPGAPGS